MFPAQPPLPTCSYLPFHAAAAGSHSSNLIWESLVGLAVAFTTQCAGTFSVAAAISADVTVVCGTFRPARLSQVCATAGLANNKTQLKFRQVFTAFYSLSTPHYQQGTPAILSPVAQKGTGGRDRRRYHIVEMDLAEPPVDYRADPEHYCHWTLKIEGPVATLTLDV